MDKTSQGGKLIGEMKKSKQGSLFNYFKPTDNPCKVNGINESPSSNTNGVEKISPKVKVGLSMLSDIV